MKIRIEATNDYGTFAQEFGDIYAANEFLWQTPHLKPSGPSGPTPGTVSGAAWAKPEPIGPTDVSITVRQGRINEAGQTSHSVHVARGDDAAREELFQAAAKLAAGVDRGVPGYRVSMGDRHQVLITLVGQMGVAEFTMPPILRG